MWMPSGNRSWPASPPGRDGATTQSERYARTQCLVTSASLLPTAPTPAAVKMRVFGFIDWSQAGSVVVAQVLD